MKAYYLLPAFLAGLFSAQIDSKAQDRPSGQANIRELFLKEFDKNKDGKLDESERPSREQAQEFFRRQQGNTPSAPGQAQQLSESQLARLLKRFPAADANGDGKLTQKEFDAARQKFRQSRQGNARPAAAAQTKLVFDPGWEKEKFPSHAVSLKTPEEIMALYKRGLAGQTPLRESDALSFPKPADGIMRIVGTGHSFMRPGYVTLPLITQAAGFEQPLSLHLGGGIKGSTRYKWEQENGIFEFDRKPLPKLLAAISNAKWEAMVWGPYTGDRPAFYTCWIDFCTKYNPGMKFYLSDAWPAPGHVRKVFKLQANPESEAFFTDAVYDQLSADAIAGFGGLVKTLRKSTKKVYILPTHAAMTEAAKRFLRGELPGFKGLYKVIGGKEPSIWRDRIGHIHPGLESLEGYVFYATLYGKSPELISAPIKFKDDPSLPSAALDKIFREIAWKAVVEHPLSGVTDKNKNGIGDHLESRQVGDAALNKTLEDLFKGDTNHDQRISKKEFIWPAVLFDTFDQNKDGFITRNEAKTLLPTSSAELKELWAYGLISRRTGTPLIEPAGEHQLDRTKVSYGYNQVVDRKGQVLRPGGRPLQGGERLILIKEYQKDANVREYARVFTYMAPIRDALLYNFDNTTKKEWLELTQILKINNIKTTPAQGIGPRTVLSIDQVYDYIKRRPRVGSPVMRFLEEAELELKCLALDPSKSPVGGGQNMTQHCQEHGKPIGSGLKIPK